MRRSHPVPAPLAGQLAQASEEERNAVAALEAARRRLRAELRDAQSAGHSVRALALATGRSVTRTQALLTKEA